MKSSRKDLQKSSNDSEKPIFTPKDLVQAITRKKLEELNLKKRVIVTFDGASLQFLKEKTGAILNRAWYPYRRIYEIPNKDTAITRSYPSGPCLTVLTEEMSNFGSEEIVVFGFCGSLTEKISIGDGTIARGAISDEGTSRQYTKSYSKVVLSNWFKEWEHIAKENGLINSVVWTTDGLYRETKRKVEYFRAKGAHTVDMETASFYTVCNYLKVKGIAFLLVSDTLKDGIWTPGFHMKKFKNGTERMLKFLIEECIL